MKLSQLTRRDLAWIIVMVTIVSGWTAHALYLHYSVRRSQFEYALMERSYYLLRDGVYDAGFRIKSEGRDAIQLVPADPNEKVQFRVTAKGFRIITRDDDAAAGPSVDRELSVEEMMRATEKPQR